MRKIDILSTHDMCSKKMIGTTVCVMPQPIVKLLIIFLMGGFFLGLFGGQTFAGFSETMESQGCFPKTFVITAYYSPLPGQSFYVKGDEYADKVLNGQGTHGASGQPVFNGMLAAPKTYAFGTKIYLPGRGRGRVEDRGGAIVTAGNRGWDHDRLDVWMGYGEEGLIRAMSFGVQTIDSRECPASAKTIVYQDGAGASMGFDRGRQDISKHFILRTLFVQTLSEGSKGVWVRELRKNLALVGFPSPADADQYRFDRGLSNLLCSYQVRHQIVTRASEYCGLFGPTTRQRLFLDLRAGGFLPADYGAWGSVDDVRQYAQYGVFSLPQVTIVAQDLGDSPAVSSSSLNKLVYTRLQLLGYDVGEYDGRYSLAMREAMKQFQLSHQLYTGSDPSIGTYTTKTKEIMEKINRKTLSLLVAVK